MSSNPKIETGRVYTVAGRGEVLVEELPAPPHKTTVTALGHGNIRVWIDADDILREATPEDIRLRQENAAARGVQCRDPECWCRAAEV